MALTDDSSQKASDRPISFLMQRGNEVIVPTFNLIIRPEELTRSEPSRINVQQTLGGAFADSFDRGLSQIVLSGHTGWRGGNRIGLNSADGRNLFFDLRENIYIKWHEQRALAIKNGTDPNAIELFFADTLDDISVILAPMSFNLRRSRSRPLLMMYQITLLVLRDANVSPSPAPDTLLAVDQPRLDRLALSAQSVSALQSSIDSLKSISADIQAAYKTAAAPIVALCNQGAELLQVAHDQVDAIQETVTMPILEVAGDVQLASHNITQTVMDGLGGSEQAKLTLKEAASTFREAACNLANLSANLSSYLNFDSLQGASNCSSTTGGSPPSPYKDVNVFTLITVPPQPSTPLTADGSAAVQEAKADMLSLNSHTLAYKMNLASRIAAGITV